ncbi:MAG: hypothetical protein ACE5GC_05950 [Acidimicrobiia bacterium]
MRFVEFLKWVHLLAVATWTGGLITLAALVPTMRREGADQAMLRAVARQFSRVTWTALVVAVGTGVWQVDQLRIPWSDGTLGLKLTLVGTAAALALGHQLTARRSSAAVRGAIQGLILLVSIAIFGVAVTL